MEKGEAEMKNLYFFYITRQALCMLQKKYTFLLDISMQNYAQIQVADKFDVCFF
jgi:hypothetical protein